MNTLFHFLRNDTKKQPTNKTKKHNKNKNVRKNNLEEKQAELNEEILISKQYEPTTKFEIQQISEEESLRLRISGILERSETELYLLERFLFCSSPFPFISFFLSVQLVFIFLSKSSSNLFEKLFSMASIYFCFRCVDFTDTKETFLKIISQTKRPFKKRKKISNNKNNNPIDDQNYTVTKQNGEKGETTKGSNSTKYEFNKKKTLQKRKSEGNLVKPAKTNSDFSGILSEDNSDYLINFSEHELDYQIINETETETEIEIETEIGMETEKKNILKDKILTNDQEKMQEKEGLQRSKTETFNNTNNTDFLDTHKRNVGDENTTKRHRRNSFNTNYKSHNSKKENSTPQKSPKSCKIENDKRKKKFQKKKNKKLSNEELLIPDQNTLNQQDFDNLKFREQKFENINWQTNTLKELEIELEKYRI
ncbi:hypothetical protein M0813_22894 [Anaeramoeba flamelloides]|uniref:Uncharacterized protein n=1 Tax=Anaeramoeba flamelloides TaxID=1746091 RepID=A0ABQ8YC34_9EUKA|nr:hypothetical protein M0813_22894 [Anaeramoeba flamelloides]